MFLTLSNKNYIKNILKSILYNLNFDEFNFISNICCDLIDYIHTKFLIKEEDNNKFFNQLMRNNNREIIAIFNILLPYIDDSNEFERHKKIYNLSDITLLKENNNYAISNYQFSRGYYNKSKEKYLEYPYSTEDIKINFELIKQTINRISVKMYVNWLNIVPVLLENYKDCLLYKNTIEFYKNNTKNKEETCLPIGEVYDTIISELYLNVLDFKWLLFEKNIKIENNEEKNIMFLDILNDIYPVYEIIGNKETIVNSKWLLLDDEKKILFGNNFNNFFSKIKNKESFKNYSFELIDNFMYYLLAFFDMKYNGKDDELYKNKYIKINRDDFYNDNIIEDDENQPKNKDKIKIQYYENYSKIDKYYLYDFIRSQLLKLSKSWYGYKIFKDNKIKKLDEYNLVKSKKLEISYKNIYNYGKSLALLSNLSLNFDIEEGTEQERLENEYRRNIDTFLYENKMIYIKNMIIRLFTEIYKDFHEDITKPYNDYIFYYFNISGNLRNRFEINNYSESVIKDMNIEIIKKIHINIFEIIFECLCKRGMLTEYIIRDTLFEKENINQSNKEKFYEHLKKYNKAFYYLTDDLYENLPRITDKDTLKETTYFQRLKDELLWHHTYAMDWVSQINFFHHFINQRVILLTGGTGVGKSTQTPKLLLYGLKAIDKKFDGKIICTQPRISPTIENSKQISKELGVNILNYNAIFNSEVRTIEGIVQYKYEKDDHIDDDQEYYLRIVTDGSLLTDIKKSPLIKQLINIRSTDKKNKFFSLKNMYDIIIVDESHEHNSNMDLILSLIRGSILLNNDLKLVIISATMELDDPIYRSYFRLINDNLKYPIRDLCVFDNESLNELSKYKAAKSENPNIQITGPPQKFSKLLDRIVIDRRIHISPPGQTTQFIINEIYNDIDLSEEKAYIKAIDYVREICSSNSPIDNDILLFCTTTKKIIKLVDQLNNVLPDDTIAIPFYSDLPEDSKKLITGNLPKIKNTFNFERRYIHDVLSLKVKPEDKKAGYKYNRIVIVSTNIAEASLTINSLKFVVDTGYNWNVTYNYETDTNNMESVKISESSRIQRKGRVGRVSNGSVYYTYPKDARKNILPLYDICKKNFSNELISWIEEKSIFDGGYIFNYYIFSKKLVYNDGQYMLTSILEITKNIERTKSKIDNIEQKQVNDIFSELYKKFMIRHYATPLFETKKLYLREDLFNSIEIEKDNYNNIVPFGLDGIHSNNLVDSNLSFYLIHPFENEYGKLRDTDTRTISKKAKSKTWDIILNTFNKLIKPLIQNLYVYEEKKFEYNKVVMVSKLFEIREKTDKLIDINLLYPLVVSYKLGIFENVLFIVYFLISVKFNLSEVIEDINLFKNIFSSKESDFLVINKIYELFKSTYFHLLFDDSLNNKNEALKSEFKQSYNNYKYGYLNKLTITQYNDIINLILKNNNIEVFNEKLFNNVKFDKFKDYILLEIKGWCGIYGINFESFIRIIYEFKERYYKYKVILDNEKYNKYIIASSIDNELSVEKNIIKSFLFGNINKIFIVENGIYKNIFKYDSLQKYLRMNIDKKWISQVLDNHFIFSLYKENAQIKEDAEETDNKTVLLSLLSSIDNQLYAKLVYYTDNPTNKEYGSINDINHQFICNNPINIENMKHPGDPRFNEYINILQIDMKKYIDTYC